MTIPTILEFATDPQLLNLSLSIAQETLLRGIYGLSLPTGEHHDIWHACTGGRTYRDGHHYPEVTVIAGARAGKDSRILAPVLCFEATFGGHEQHLHRGERAVIPLVAQDQRATGISRGYIFEYFRRSPLLSSLIEDERQSELDLRNRTTIACFPCTKSSLRGWSNPAGGFNEIAFWRLERAADADVEVQRLSVEACCRFPGRR